ncbi:MAG: hypothetical protein P5681_14195 [Limnospira sp. PMC 894.15]|uniref:hypothetical protein n=1 Tax=Limnospira sp. PMC 917.15 TaxID=2981106 RepID=UPI000AF1C80C|nr:hypothetical protein [Limnospira sp. PMC 917.15]MDT9188963.1 hypothetical protein [Limnospira sp. PMC 894.15]MDT9234245.1 hypothetical protein [Limnospira sp. PMC 917.15]
MDFLLISFVISQINQSIRCPQKRCDRTGTFSRNYQAIALMQNGGRLVKSIHQFGEGTCGYSRFLFQHSHWMDTTQLFPSFSITLRTFKTLHIRIGAYIFPQRG